MRFGRAFFGIILLICALEMLRLWNITPSQMAAHFNVQGNSDRFVPKLQFFWFQLQTMLVVIATSLLPQILILFLPPQLINMPNRDYWLSPEQRDATIDRLSSFAAAVFGIILLEIQVGFEISTYANLRTPVVFNAQLMILSMIASFILIGLMLFWLTMSFRLPVQND